MKAMILAAGRGERLRPLTDSTPKPLLRVGGRALIDYHIESLVKAGITDIVINLAWLGEQIREHLDGGGPPGALISYSDEGEQRLDTGGGIKNALTLLGPEPFLVINADIYCEIDYQTLPTNPDALAHLVMVDNPPHHSAGDFVIKSDRLTDDDGERLTYSGIGIYRAELFADCEKKIFPLAPVLRSHFAEGNISARHYTGMWTDAGTVERLADLDRYLKLL